MINTILLRLAGMSNQRALVLSVIAAALFYVTMYDDGSSIDKLVQELDGRITQEQARSNESDAALKELDQYRSSVGGLNQQFKIAAQQLPTEISASEILRSIDTISKSTGVSIKSKEPKSAVREDILEMQPLHVVVHGTYSEITMFLYYLSSMERITRVVNFSFSQPDLNLSASKVNDLIFDGEIVSYKFIGTDKADSTSSIQGGK